MKPYSPYKINFKTKYTEQNQKPLSTQKTLKLFHQFASPSVVTKSAQLVNKQSSIKDAINSIKGEIHKLRTQSPQITQINFIEQRSKSYFFSRSPKNKRIQEQKPGQMLMKMVHKGSQRRRQTKSYLPELRISQITKYSPKCNNNFDEYPALPYQNVILLKRGMRYRLQKLPPFKVEKLNDFQPNITVSGWGKNQEEVDQYGEIVNN